MGHLTGKPIRPDWPAAWSAVRDRLRRELGDPVFEAWIGPLSLESSDRDELKIGATKPFVRNWVANHYIARIERAFRAEGAEPVSLSIVMSASPPSIGGNALSTREPADLPAASVSCAAAPCRAGPGMNSLEDYGPGCCIPRRPLTA